MDKHGDSIICGKRGGLQYKDLVRPLGQMTSSNWCPSNYEKCSDFTNFANTICYDTTDSEAKSKCPITDIKVVTNLVL